uniref:glycosyltransferase n=1 Tax=Altererythrobacter segetis TaxID=1104773 RepID=UPI0014085D8E|nr:glycosyltransferase [Altererythrobacter segetis]
MSDIRAEWGLADSSPPDRIAIFLPDLGGGGAERVMVTLANEFLARGVAVDLVLVDKSGPYLSLVADGVRIIDLRARRMARALPPLVRYLRAERPKTLLSALSHSNIVAVLAGRLARTSVRVVLSERVSYLAYEQFGHGFSNTIVQKLMKLLYPAADAVVTVAEAMIDELASKVGVPRDRLFAIANPVVDDELRIQALAEPSFWPPLPEGRRVVLGAGRLSPQKDFATLIDAFDRVWPEVDAALVIIGEGPMRGELEALVAARDLQDRVFLPGFLSPPFPLMRRADLFVLSSRFEGLPGTLIQAMACGTPVVSTDCPTGPSQILDGGKWGVLVPVGDVEALASAMTKSLLASDHPDVVRRAEVFGVRQTTDAYLEVLLPRRRSS